MGVLFLKALNRSTDQKRDWRSVLISWKASNGWYIKFDSIRRAFSHYFSIFREAVMLGLTSLVRLLRHHPAIVLSQIHPVILALGRQIRNLRSQVSRAACQAAAEMFVALKRNIEVVSNTLGNGAFPLSCAEKIFGFKMLL